MEVEERDDSVLFLHRLSMGSVGRSLGIHVARMAGVPDAVTHRAAVLATVQPGTMLADGAPSRYRGTSALVTSDSVETDVNHRLLGSDSHDGTIPATARDVVLALAGCNVAAITPIEAINLLFSLQRRAAACLPELDV